MNLTKDAKPEDVIHLIQSLVIDKKGVFHYDPHGYDAMKEAIEQYGKIMFEKGKEQ